MHSQTSEFQARSISVAVRLLLIGVVAFGFTASLVAQTSGTILGTVKDQSGAVLPGASVTATNTETGISRTATSGSRGEFRLSAMTVGNYEVKTELAGFQTGVRKGVTLNVGQEAVVDVTLSVGNVAEQVTVTGEAPLIETTSASVSGLVDPKQMKDIPLNARSFIELVPLQTGAVFADSGDQSATKGFGKKLSIVGTRYNQNSFLLDGADINDATGSAGSAAGTLAGVETVQEFRVITNAYDAEYGRHTGGVISAITKSGTNQFHGSAFEFLRNSKLDAAKWEDNAFHNGEKAAFKRNQFGGSFGGPIKKDKTFFFGSYEGLRQSLGVTQTYNVPGMQARTGNRVAIDPVMAPYVAVYPVPNILCKSGCLAGAAGAQFPTDRADGTAQYSNVSSQPTHQNYFNVRADNRISDKDSFFGRFNFDNADQFQPALNTGVQSKTANRFATVEDTHIFSPTLLSRTLFSYNRTRIDLFDVYLPGGKLPRFNFSDDPTTPGEMTISTLTSLGGSNTNPKAYIQNMFQVKHDFFWSKGAHSFKFGGQFERIQFNEQRNAFYLPGQFDFSGLTQFLTRAVNAAHFVRPGSDDIRGVRQNINGLYIQDDVNLRPGLTLNLGVRYEFISVPTEVNGKLATVRDLSPAHFYTMNTNQTDTGNPYFQNPSLKNFAPRVGIAWTPFKNGKTSVRAGAGEFHDQILPSYYQTAMGRIPPYFAVAEMFNTSIRNVNNGVGIDFPNAFFSQNNLLVQNIGSVPQFDGFQYDVSQPAVYKWGMDIQQQLFKDTTLDVGYSGTRGTHLVRGNLNLNATPSTIINGRRFIMIATTPTNPITLNPNIGRMRWRLTDGDSFYHGLRAEVTKRFSHSFQIQGSYTYSKSIDDSSTFTGSSDFGSADRTAYLGQHEKALSGFDVTQSFFLNFVYELPGRQLTGVAGKVLGGWSLSSVLRMNSGNPLNISALQPQYTGVPGPGLPSGTFAANYADGSTLDLIPGGIQAKTTGTTAGCGGASGIRSGQTLGGPDLYFDPCQFAFPANCLTASCSPIGFFQGSLGRNVLRSPGVTSLDATLGKSTKVPWLGEQGGLEFRAEFYNLLNRANFALPALSVFGRTGALQSGVGQITTTRFNSRQIQFALRLVF